MMKILTKFMDSNEISELITQILGNLVSGFSLGSEDFETNIIQIKEKLSKYIQ